MTSVVVSPISVAMFPEGGGHFWVFLQWVRGFQRAGCDVWWLECLDRHYGREPDQRVIDIFMRNLAAVGLSERVIVYRIDESGQPEFLNVPESVAWSVLDRADLLVNFRYQITPTILERVGRSALIDIDPGLLQFWLSHDQLDLARHDVYFTTGETIGTDLVPDCGLEWELIRPAVDTVSWPFVTEPARPELTTITNWFGEWLTDGADFLMDNSKRIEFLRLIDLPRQTDQPLELAVCFGENPEDLAEQVLLTSQGWNLQHSFDVAGDPFSYQEYVQTSRGEFSCVKPSCLRFQNAWISDRTLCYLASGRPAVVQDTGPSMYLPDREGLLRFNDRDSAIAAIDDLNTRYDHHRHAARDLAERLFDAELVAKRVLERALPA